nr:MAG TPA: hypothetical protein [Caudoviricetes sp.]DAS47222.1 MAG TPA: hypothetical protein [Caudoviricetes sp.]
MRVFLRDIYRLLHIFLDLLKVPSLHRNFPSAVQALMPPLPIKINVS